MKRLIFILLLPVFAFALAFASTSKKQYAEGVLRT